MKPKIETGFTVTAIVELYKKAGSDRRKRALYFEAMTQGGYSMADARYLLDKDDPVLLEGILLGLLEHKGIKKP